MQLTRKAIEDGYKTIISVGGDGTVNEVLNGFFKNGKLLDDSASMGVFPGDKDTDFVCCDGAGILSVKGIGNVSKDIILISGYT